MKERPIIFSGPMVLAILEGRKTQTRRKVNTKRFASIDWEYASKGERCLRAAEFAYGIPGDRLWVRETHRYWWPDWENPGSHPCRCRYKADDAIINLPVEWDEGYQTLLPEDVNLNGEPYKWRPSIYMPRWASRIVLEITGVRVERLQEISEADAQAEGVTDETADAIQYGAEAGNAQEPTPYRTGLSLIWQSIPGPESWQANPWVWVISFKKI